MHCEKHNLLCNNRRAAGPSLDSFLLEHEVMNAYIKKDGATYTGSAMRAPALLPGHWWVNVSRLGASPQRFVETEMSKEKS